MIGHASASAGIGYYKFVGGGLILDEEVYESIGLALSGQASISSNHIGIGIKGFANISKSSFAGIALFVEIGEL